MQINESEKLFMHNHVLTLAKIIRTFLSSVSILYTLLNAPYVIVCMYVAAEL